MRATNIEASKPSKRDRTVPTRDQNVPRIKRDAREDASRRRLMPSKAGGQKKSTVSLTFIEVFRTEAISPTDAHDSLVITFHMQVARRNDLINVAAGREIIVIGNVGQNVRPTDGQGVRARSAHCDLLCSRRERGANIAGTRRK